MKGNGKSKDIIFDRTGFSGRVVGYAMRNRLVTDDVSRGV